MSQLDELRRIIVGGNSEELAALKKRIESIDARTRDVAEVLAPAISRGVQKNQDLVNALKDPVSAGLKQAIRAEPNVYADILYPAISPSIRLAISQAISSLLVTINQTMASATSISGLQTRFESFRSGIPYAELSLRKSLLYRVEHIYLIDRDSGLLIAECAASDGQALDSDAVSAMFSAIQSFVQDSFSGNQEDRLTDFRVGAHTVWVVHGPTAMLACVIFGDAPQTLKSQLHDSLDSIRTGYAAQIESFNGDASGFAGVEESMQPLLQLRLKEGFEPGPELGSKINTASRVLLLGFAALAVYLFAQWFIRDSKLGTVQHYLSSTPGLVMTSAYWKNKRLVIEGLQDPDARLPYRLLQAHSIGADDLDLRTTPFRSLEPGMEKQRFLAELRPPAAVELLADKNGVTLSGKAPIRWLLQHDARLRQLAADKRIDISGLAASQVSVNQYIDVSFNGMSGTLKRQLAESLLDKPWVQVSVASLMQAASITRIPADTN